MREKGQSFIVKGTPFPTRRAWMNMKRKAFATKRKAFTMMRSPFTMTHDAFTLIRAPFTSDTTSFAAHDASITHVAPCLNLTVAPLPQIHVCVVLVRPPIATKNP